MPNSGPGCHTPGASRAMAAAGSGVFGAERQLLYGAIAKNFILGWRRKRTRQVIIPMTLYSVYILALGSSPQMA